MQTEGPFQYLPFPETFLFPAAGSYRSFGIRCVQKRSGQAVCELHDVGLNGEIIGSLAHRFTLHQLSPLHLRDAVYDFLCL